MPRAALAATAVAALALASFPAAQATGAGKQVGLNVVLSVDLTPDVVSDLSAYGTVDTQYPEIDAVTMQVTGSQVTKVGRLPYVESATQDAERFGRPVAASSHSSTVEGIATWNTDQIDVYDVATGAREVAATGKGVYVAVLDTGLHSSWPYYFGDRIAAKYGVAFGGGGGERGSVSTQPDKWGKDQQGHGTHVTSSVLGYNFNGTAVGGVAPEATVIPVKVLGQNGSGWSSVITAGIDYVTDLKEGPLADSPVVINMSLGGPTLDPLERAALDRAITAGVLVVAAAGNEGAAGMGYPGAYSPVISVAASGWTGEWIGGPSWWNSMDVADPTRAADAYITEFSSRPLSGQDLDVAAPGSWVVGPYQTNSQLSYYYLGGTSMASPHVAGAVALIAERNSALTQVDAEHILEGTALGLPAGSAEVVDPSTGRPTTVTWDAKAAGAGLLDVPAAVAAAHDKAGSTATGTPGNGNGKGGRAK